MNATSPTITPLQQSASDITLGRIVREVWAPSTWLALLHMLMNLPLGIIWFVVLAVGLSIGTGLLITLLGIPVLIATAWAIRAIGGFERARINALLGTDMRDPYRPSVAGAGWIARLAAIGKDPATWRDFLFLILRLPIGMFTFVTVVAAWSIALALLCSPVGLVTGVFNMSLGPWVLDGPFAAVLAWIGGVAMTVLAAWITRGLAELERQLAGALLAASPEALQQQVAALASSRARTMNTSDQERRRLERDLHDGAQQRLVSLAMTLGLAQQKLTTDPDQAAQLVSEAHEEAKRALQELRDLARGLHPAILTDRGLESALPALAARCQIPTRVDVAVSPRPTAAVESAAYFVVAEALTNVARHSNAASVVVTAQRVDNQLTITVRDDGAGGAQVVDGGGLAGLVDRVEALGGRLTVSSPSGGPTEVRVEVPCG